MLRCINMLETPSGGEILFHGKNIAERGIDVNQYRSRVGMVFQNFNLFANKTVLQNCMLGQIKVLKKSKEEARERAMMYLRKVGMDSLCECRQRSAFRWTETACGDRPGTVHAAGGAAVR